MIAGHDPTVIAWFITAAYFAAAVLTWFAARCSADRRERLVWFCCAAALVLLGFNKQLDLQGYVTAAGRVLAHQEGWFAERRLVQSTFIIMLCAVAVAAILFLAVWLRRSTRSVKFAATGIVLLFGFVVIRAASFHHMDILVTRNIAGMRSGWWLELAGIIIVGISAGTFRRRNRAPLARL